MIYISPHTHTDKHTHYIKSILKWGYFEGQRQRNISSRITYGTSKQMGTFLSRLIHGNNIQI